MFFFFFNSPDLKKNVNNLKKKRVTCSDTSQSNILGGAEQVARILVFQLEH